MKQPNSGSIRANSPYFFQADTVAEFGGWTRTLTSEIRRLSSSSTAAAAETAAEEEDFQNEADKLQGE